MPDLLILGLFAEVYHSLAWESVGAKLLAWRVDRV